MSNQAEGKPRAAFAVIGGVIAVLVLIVGSFVLFGGGDDDASSADPGGSTPTSTPASGSESATPTPSEAPESVPYLKAARKAGHDGFPALVPDLPSGWAVTAATYTGGDQPTWHLELVTGQGDTVTVDQAETDLAALVDQYAAGATEGAPVDLDKWQTGTWRSWSGEGSEALGKDMKSTAVLLVGADRVANISTAKRLLTIETSGPVVGD